jgi:glycosyltransferase involved in cell wall biosynthesis
VVGDTLTIVTARNEAERIGATVAALARSLPGAPVLLADDCSSDATAEIAREAGARVLRGARAVGKGGAATLAARAALGEWGLNGGDGGGDAVVLFCDGDLGDSAARLAALVHAVRAGEADVAVAAFRRRRGGGLGVAVAFARWAIRRRCGLRAAAPISGQRAMRAHVLSDVLPFAAGFGMELAMTIDAVRAGYRVVEIELDLTHRATGRTPAGFAHRARQLWDFARAYLARG